MTIDDLDDDLDICCCIVCGEPVVCVPDGLAMCDKCAEAESEE